MRCGIPDAYPSGRKGAESDERRRDETRRDDEGRRGSRTAALNAVPSDRQHRLLRGSFSASSDSELSLSAFSLKLRHARIALRSLFLSVTFFFSHTHSFSTTPLPSFPPPSPLIYFSLLRFVLAWRGRGSRDNDEGKVVAGGKRGTRAANGIISRVYPAAACVAR